MEFEGSQVLQPQHIKPARMPIYKLMNEDKCGIYVITFGLQCTLHTKDLSTARGDQTKKIGHNNGLQVVRFGNVGPINITVTSCRTVNDEFDKYGRLLIVSTYRKYEK